MAELWRRWLIAAAAITGVVGLGFVLLASLGATRILGAIFDLVYLPGARPGSAGAVASFAIGVAGAVMVGWAAMTLVLFGSRSTSALPTTWRALTVGMLAWFVVDGIVSITSGATGNLVLNVVFLVLFAPPLIATRPGRASTAVGGTPAPRT